MELSRNLLSNYSTEEAACLLSHGDNGSLVSLLVASAIIVKCDNPLVDFLLEHSIWTQYAWECAAAFSPAKSTADLSRTCLPGIIRKITRLVYEQSSKQIYVETLVTGRGWSEKDRGSMFREKSMTQEIAMSFYRGAATLKDLEEYYAAEEARLSVVESKEESDLSAVVTGPAQFIETDSFDNYVEANPATRFIGSEDPNLLNNNKAFNTEDVVPAYNTVSVKVEDVYKLAEHNIDPDFVVVQKIRQGSVSTVFAADDLRLFVLSIPNLNGFTFYYEGEEAMVTTDMKDDVAAAAMINWVYGARYASKSPEARSVFGLYHPSKCRRSESGYYGEVLPDAIYYAWSDLVAGVKWRNVANRLEGVADRKEIITWQRGLRELLQKYSYEDGNYIPGGLDGIAVNLFSRPIEVGVSTAKKYRKEVLKEEWISKRLYKDLDRVLFTMQDQGMTDQLAFRYVVGELAVFLYCCRLASYERLTFLPRRKKGRVLIKNSGVQYVTQLCVEMASAVVEYADPSLCLDANNPRVTVLDYLGWDKFIQIMPTIRPHDDQVIMFRMQDEHHYLVPRIMQYLHDRGFSSRYCRNDISGEGRIHYLVIGSKFAFPRLNDELSSLLSSSHYPSLYGFEYGKRTADDYALARSLLFLSAKFHGTRDLDKDRISKKFATIYYGLGDTN